MLTEKGIVNYCPLNRIQRQWSDRKKIVFEPLFKGYVFIQVEESKKWDAKSCQGIINYVYWLGKPAVVQASEIDTIKRFMEEFDDVEVVDLQIKEKDPVVVKSGTFMDYKGIVLELSGYKAKVKIDSMGVSLVAIFDKKNLNREIIQ